MAYFEDRALRHYTGNTSVGSDLARVAGILLLFAVLATTIAWTAPTTGAAPAGEDWHGNVASSAGRV